MLRPSVGSGAPRKAKERKEGRSMELMDLAFAQRMSVVNGQVVEQYTPQLHKSYLITYRSRSVQYCTASFEFR